MRAEVHKDHRETVQRLFAIATMLASEAQEIAVAGQSPKLRGARRHALISKLQGRAAELGSVADSILTVTALAARE